nr:hypothetical protein [Solanum melongena]
MHSFLTKYVSSVKSREYRTYGHRPVRFQSPDSHSYSIMSVLLFTLVQSWKSSPSNYIYLVAQMGLEAASGMFLVVMGKKGRNRKQKRLDVGVTVQLASLPISYVRSPSP